MATGKKEQSETLTPPQRWAELLIVAAMLFLFGFFILHQMMKTGFFTARFGTLEMVALYGPIFAAVVPPIIRAVTGRRNPARPSDAAANLFLALGSLWLLIAFPFDFPHLGDILPAPLRILLSWVTNGLGKVPLVLQVVIGVSSAVRMMARYMAVRRQESAASLPHPTS